MPSTISTLVSSALASSTVITPSLPTFCIASAIILPTVVSPFAEMVPTWATSAVDAALEVHRVHPGGNRLGAFTHDRGGEHRRRRGAVAGHVVGLRGDLAHHLRAHVLELVVKLDFLGDSDAVLGDARCAEALVEHDVAALGAQRDLHRIGQRLYAAQHALAGVAGKFYVLGS